MAAKSSGGRGSAMAARWAACNGASQLMKTTSMSRYQTLNSALRRQQLPARKVLAPVQAPCYSLIAKRAEDFGPLNSKPGKRSGGPRIPVPATRRDAVPPRLPPLPPFQGLCSRADSTGDFALTLPKTARLRGTWTPKATIRPSMALRPRAARLMAGEPLSSMAWSMSDQGRGSSEPCPATSCSHTRSTGYDRNGAALWLVAQRHRGGLVMRPAFARMQATPFAGGQTRDSLRVANPNDQLSAPAEDHVSRLDRRRGLLDSGGMVRLHALPLLPPGDFAGLFWSRRSRPEHHACHIRNRVSVAPARRLCLWSYRGSVRAAADNALVRGAHDGDDARHRASTHARSSGRGGWLVSFSPPLRHGILGRRRIYRGGRLFA